MAVIHFVSYTEFCFFFFIYHHRQPSHSFKACGPKKQLLQGANSEIVYPVSGSRQLKTYPLLAAHTPLGQLCFRRAAWFQTRPFFM